MDWRRLNGQKIDTPIYSAVEKAIIQEKELGHKLKVCIGTDSQVRAENTEYRHCYCFSERKKGRIYVHFQLQNVKKNEFEGKDDY